MLPDKPLEWRDVIVGAVMTAVLFNLGKYLVGFYIGQSSVSSSYGPAGALIVVLLWIYYSSEIFLLGAEFTKVFAAHHGSQRPAVAHPEEPERRSTGHPRPVLVRSRPLLTVVAVISMLIQATRRRRGS